MLMEAAWGLAAVAALAVLAYAVDRWHAVRVEDARARMRCADVRAERYRIPLDTEIERRIGEAVGAALAAHRAELDALAQDVADARSRAEMRKAR
jgi:hypothetical protein